MRSRIIPFKIATWKLVVVTFVVDNDTSMHNKSKGIVLKDRMLSV